MLDRLKGEIHLIVGIKDGWPPKTTETVQTTGRALEVDIDLPLSGIPSLPIQ